MTSKPKTIGELRRSGYKVAPVKVELERNLIKAMERGEELFPGIVGYDNTVIPQTVNAILSHHDMVFLGDPPQNNGFRGPPTKRGQTAPGGTSPAPLQSQTV